MLPRRRAQPVMSFARRSPGWPRSPGERPCRTRPRLAPNRERPGTLGNRPWTAWRHMLTAIAMRPPSLPELQPSNGIKTIRKRWRCHLKLSPTRSPSPSPGGPQVVAALHDIDALWRVRRRLRSSLRSAGQTRLPANLNHAGVVCERRVAALVECEEEGDGRAGLIRVVCLVVPSVAERRALDVLTSLPVCLHLPTA